MTNYSFESLISDGIYGGIRKESISLEGFKNFGAFKVFTDSSDSSEFYAIEAQRLYNEANQINLFINNSLESFSVNVALVKALKKKVGTSLEGLDPVRFVTEAAGGVGSFFSKLWQGIKEFFKKLAQAIINFIKSVIQFIKVKFISFVLKFMKKITII